MSKYLFLINLCLLPLLSHAQDTTGRNVTSAFDLFLEENKSILDDSFDYYGNVHAISKLKAEIAKEQYFERQYAQYFTENLAHRKDTFNWQLKSTKLIFWMVILIVLCGLIFSGIQFYNTIKYNDQYRKPHSSKNDTIEEDVLAHSRTEIELSLTSGIKVTSSIVGLIILTISIAFFYLYIFYVYPINRINIDNAKFNSIESVKE